MIKASKRRARRAEQRMRWSQERWCLKYLFKGTAKSSSENRKRYNMFPSLSAIRIARQLLITLIPEMPFRVSALVDLRKVQTFASRQVQVLLMLLVLWLPCSNQDLPRRNVFREWELRQTRKRILCIRKLLPFLSKGKGSSSNIEDSSEGRKPERGNRGLTADSENKKECKGRQRHHRSPSHVVCSWHNVWQERQGSGQGHHWFWC